MDEFLELLPPSVALATFLEEFVPAPKIESISTENALGRVLIQSVKAPFALPAFRRSTVDGYALRASETHGASDSLPAYLDVAGEVLMGEESHLKLEERMCSVIYTGGMLPQDSDAVVMIENTQISRGGEIEIYRAVAPGENVIQIGEDVTEGVEIIAGGVRIGPSEIGGLMALGITIIPVSQRPKVGIISSGDEVISPGENLRPGQVYDINSYTLGGLVQEAGGTAVSYGIAEDTFPALHDLAQKALDECDLVVLTAGSSLSTRDLTAEVINSLGDPGVIVHGVNVRPGKPTILGVCDGKPMVGLPGNPASALVIARIFVIPVIEALLGGASQPRAHSLVVPIQVNLNSVSGREDYVPVQLMEGSEGIVADPVFGKSNLIFTLVQADGLVHIPADATGVAAGQLVRVEFL